MLSVAQHELENVQKNTDIKKERKEGRKRKKYEATIVQSGKLLHEVLFDPETVYRESLRFASP